MIPLYSPKYSPVFGAIQVPHKQGGSGSPAMGGGSAPVGGGSAPQGAFGGIAKNVGDLLGDLAQDAWDNFINPSPSDLDLLLADPWSSTSPQWGDLPYSPIDPSLLTPGEQYIDSLDSGGISYGDLPYSPMGSTQVVDPITGSVVFSDGVPEWFSSQAMDMPYSGIIPDEYAAEIAENTVESAATEGAANEYAPSWMAGLARWYADDFSAEGLPYAAFYAANPIFGMVTDFTTALANNDGASREAARQDMYRYLQPLAGDIYMGLYGRDGVTDLSYNDRQYIDDFMNWAQRGYGGDSEYTGNRPLLRWLDDPNMVAQKYFEFAQDVGSGAWDLTGSYIGDSFAPQYGSRDALGGWGDSDPFDLYTVMGDDGNIYAMDGVGSLPDHFTWNLSGYTLGTAPVYSGLNQSGEETQRYQTYGDPISAAYEMYNYQNMGYNDAQTVYDATTGGSYVPTMNYGDLLNYPQQMSQTEYLNTIGGRIENAIEGLESAESPEQRAYYENYLNDYYNSFNTYTSGPAAAYNYGLQSDMNTYTASDWENYQAVRSMFDPYMDIINGINQQDAWVL